MCNRGSWRGFHSRYLKTPKGHDDPLVIMEQCTECGSYRARDAEGLPYVAPDEQEEVRQDDGVPDSEEASDFSSTGSDTLPDPESGSGEGSVWGPDSDTTSGDDGSW